MKRIASLALAAALTLAGCEGFKEAMTAHVDVAARAGSQELSVERLGDLLGNADQVAINQDIARAVADVWINYQLLALAAARGDSLDDHKVLDEILWMEIASMKVQKLRDSLSRGWLGDTTFTDAQYAQGNVLSAQHILIGLPPNPTPQQTDSVRRLAESVRARANAQNFPQLVNQYTADQGSKATGGMYPAFERGTMVPEFEKAVLALQPGEIAPLVQTRYGFHIIRRPLLPEVRSQLGRHQAMKGAMSAESTYNAKLDVAGNLKVSEKAAETVRAVAQSPEQHRDDETVIASSSAGKLTAKRLATFIRSIPDMQQQGQIRQMLSQSPDSMLTGFMKELGRQDLMVREADRAKMGPDSVQLTQLRESFARMVQTSWQRLGVDPRELADSAKSEDDRERLAAARIERYMDALLRNQADYVPMPEQLERLLRSEYDASVTPAGLDRAVERALAIRAVVDSARAAQPRPPSVVPMPGEQPPPGAARGTAPPATPPARGGPPPAAPPPPDGR